MAGPRLVVPGEQGLGPKAGGTFGEGACHPAAAEAPGQIDGHFATSTFCLLRVREAELTLQAAFQSGQDFVSGGYKK